MVPRCIMQIRAASGPPKQSPCGCVLCVLCVRLVLVPNKAQVVVLWEKGRVATRIQTWVQNATLPSASCAPSQPRFLVPVRGEPESHLTLDRGAGPVAGPALVGIGMVGEVAAVPEAEEGAEVRRPTGRNWS